MRDECDCVTVGTTELLEHEFECSYNEHVEMFVQDLLDMYNTMRLAVKYEPKAKQDEAEGVANPIMIKNGEREGGEQEFEAEGGWQDSYITLRGALNEIELRN
eukprot:9254756-Alexandrium_andersonii.AAC.1